MQRSSAHPGELLFNGEVSYFLPTRCPLIGKSCKMQNLYYNFGINRYLLENMPDELNLSLYNHNAKYIAKLVAQDLQLPT